VSGFLQEKLGKKRCMIFANLPGLVGWILLYYANTSLILYTSTLLMGFSMGFGAGATSSYVGEISEPRLRGSLGSLGGIALRLGSSVIFVLGYFFEWRTVALLSSICPILCICLVVFVRYYVHRS